ncbi:MAG: hypothetical protein WKF89_01705 [Chitinophagaceae bacterium]
MKKPLLTFLAILTLSVSALSQDMDNQDKDYIKSPALGIHFFFNDFKSASVIRSSSLSSALVNKSLGKIKDMIPGLGISYMQGISKNFDFSASLGGSFLNYVVDERGSLGNESLLLEGDASINAKMFSDRYWLVPYLSAGIGLSKYKGYYGAFLPLGAGLQINFFDDAFFIINTQYRVKVTDNTSYHFFASIGIAGSIGSKKN